MTGWAEGKAWLAAARGVAAASLPDSGPAWLWYVFGALLFGLVTTVIVGLRTVSSAITTGRWMPRSTVEQIVAQLEDRIEESKVREQQWKTTAEMHAARADVTDRQLGTLLDGFETIEQFIHALPAGTRSKGPR